MYIKIRVEPGSKKETFEKESEDHFKIAVKEKAERNMANKRILLLIARHFGVVVGKVRIISGHHSPSKIIAIDIEKN
ncbi:MAG: hypothetical protein RJA61_534 [Candidatus Parcubacteria bacterium]|jgi:uncharacterized protein YggU (UPF0235/DUF167 family)